MDSLTATNLATSGTSVVLLVVVLAFVASGDYHRRRKRELLATMLFSLAWIGGAMVVWVGVQAHLPTPAMKAGVYVSTLSGPTAQLLFVAMAYVAITKDIHLRGAGTQAFASLSGLIALVGTIFALANIFNPMICEICQGGTITLGRWSHVPQVLFAAQMVVCIVLSMLHRGGSPRRQRVFNCAEIFVIPAIALAVQAYVPGLLLSLPGEAIGILVIFVVMERQIELKLAMHERQLERIRNLSLIGQIRPHFMANVLVTIERLGVSDTPRMRKAVHAFAKYFRENSFAMEHDEAAPFSKELERIEGYLELERADPNTLVEVDYDIEAEAMHAPVLPLTIEPLVKSSVRHGVGTQTQGGHVEVKAWLEGRSAEDERGEPPERAAVDSPNRKCPQFLRKQEGPVLVVEIEDNGEPFEMPAEGQDAPDSQKTIFSTRRSRIVTHVRDRLRMTCGGTLDVVPLQSGTRLVVRIPVHGASASRRRDMLGSEETIL